MQIAFPGPAQWLRKMASNFTTDTEIVLGYGGYERSGSLLTCYPGSTTLRVAMQYFGLALAGMPSMGVGRT
jgi:hypothetical protein